MSRLDNQAQTNPWRNRSLLEKNLLAFGMLALTVSLPPVPAAAPMVLVIMTAVTLGGARVPLRLWLAAGAAPAGFLLTGAASLLVSFDGQHFLLAPDGLVLAARLTLRSLAALSCLLFLALTTPATDLLSGLGRIGMPRELVEIALLIYRFLFLLADTALAMDQAQAARLGHRGVGRRLRSLGFIAANLLPRALDRARRLETGLAARAWQGEMRVLAPVRPVSRTAVVLILATEALVLALGVLA